MRSRSPRGRTMAMTPIARCVPASRSGSTSAPLTGPTMARGSLRPGPNHHPAGGCICPTSRSSDIGSITACACSFPTTIARRSWPSTWYDVGSKHEKPGRTGFAHLFEHMMFQGSEHVAKGEHFASSSRPAARSSASTWLDRTNYFETLPSHELELGLWLESDRLGSLLPAMTQEKLDNQRGGQERAPLVGGQPAVRHLGRADPGAALPGWPYLPPSDHRLHGGPERRQPGGRRRVLRHVLRSEQRGADGRRRLRPRCRAGHDREALRSDPGQRGPAAAAGHVDPAADRQGPARGGSRSRAAAAHLPCLPDAGLRQ